MTSDVTDRIVVMGVSGCGKTTIADLLADRLGVSCIDGDTLHPQSNIDKMGKGVPLVDEDRWPWLRRVGQALRAPGTIVACSALKRVYRDLIRRECGAEVTFVYLRGRRDTLIERMKHRGDRHFMPLDLLDSQMETLEEPGSDERAITVDIEATPQEIVDRILADLEGMADTRAP